MKSGCRAPYSSLPPLPPSLPYSSLPAERARDERPEQEAWAGPAGPGQGDGWAQESTIGWPVNGQLGE